MAQEGTDFGQTTGTDVVVRTTPDRVEFSETTRPRSDWQLLVLFTIATFWSAALLFVLEPLFARLILPMFGGAPAVWNTAMVFFQLALLLAYLYSHRLGRTLRGRWLVVHSIALCAGLAVLPIRIRPDISAHTLASYPIPLLLVVATATIGLPFFLTATTSPLLQKWFSQTDHRSASQPYFLYAASNVGSLVGLALYPTLLERQFTLSQQARIWFVGYFGFAVLVIACAVTAYRRRQTGDPATAVLELGSVPSLSDKLIWGVLAFVPASLLYGVTAQLCTDFPPIPLLWVLPLSIYLISFIVAFSPGFNRLRASVRVLPTVIVAAMLLFQPSARFVAWAPVGVLKLCLFAFIATAFHIEVARRRPTPAFLTTFYLWISIGGVAGGLLNAIAAPLVFSWFWEYPITLLIAAALLPKIAGVSRRPRNPFVFWTSAAVLFLASIAIRAFLPNPEPLRVLFVGLAMLLCVQAPIRWTAPVLALMAICVGGSWAGDHTIYRGRSFFGVYRVAGDAGKHILVHGTTAHGEERMDNPYLRKNPQSYYAAIRPVFDQFANAAGARFAVVGLGTGIIGCYPGGNQSVDFFEIDPLIAQIATRSDLFTFVNECPARKQIILGDARLTIRDADPGSFAIIALDAFSSDSIPVHLLTREAFDIYHRKLAPNGLLLVHVSNRLLDLAPIVAGSANYPGYSVLVLRDRPNNAQLEMGRLQSVWVLLAPSAQVAVFQSLGWNLFNGRAHSWTDDHCSVLDALAWRNAVSFHR